MGESQAPGRYLEAFLKLGIVLSGLDYAKDALEIAEGFREMLEAKQVTKLRRTQAKMTSDFLEWLDGTSSACMAWYFTASLWIAAAEGKGEADSEKLWAEIPGRMFKSNAAWRIPTGVAESK